MILPFYFSFANIGSLILFIIIICFLIAWHELGHLFVAKKCNVYCYEYSIGFGPVLFRSKKHETHFCIRAIPLGGFVKMAGEEGVADDQVIVDNNGQPVDGKRILGNQPCHKRALVLAAGGIMNIIMAIFCFYIVLSVSGGFSALKHNNEVAIIEDSTLETLGMETGDTVTKIVTYYEDSPSEIATYNIKKFNDFTEALDSKKPLKENQVQVITITFNDVSNNNEEHIITCTRKGYYEEDGEGRKSTTLSYSKIGVSQNYTTYEYNALTALYGSWHFAGYYTSEVCRSFAQLFKGDLSGLSGLVGIYETVDDVATAEIGFIDKFINIIYLIGAISFSLGFFNLIPFPALDGGRLVFVGIEAIFKKKVSPNVEATIHFVGIILLFALMIVINARDVIGLFK